MNAVFTLMQERRDSVATALELRLSCVFVEHRLRRCHNSPYTLREFGETIPGVSAPSWQTWSYATPMCHMRKWKWWTDWLLIAWNVSWVRLSYDIINTGVNESISVKAFCVLPHWGHCCFLINLWIIPWIVKMMANLKVHNFFHYIYNSYYRT